MVNFFKKSGKKAHILCQISGKISPILEKIRELFLENLVRTLENKIKKSFFVQTG